MGETVEYIDLVNEQGTIVKEHVERNDELTYGSLYMQIATVVIFDPSGNVMVHERGKYKKRRRETDLVCGGVPSGWSPFRAARAEAKQEAGVDVDDLVIARTGLNEYGRFCYLFAGFSDREPDMSEIDPTEVANPRYEPLHKLEARSLRSELWLVDGFLNDVCTARDFAIYCGGPTEGFEVTSRSGQAIA